MDGIAPDLIDFGGDTTIMSDFQIKEAAAWINYTHCKHTRFKERIIHYKHTKFDAPDFEQYRRFFGWKPAKVIKKTFETTTVGCHIFPAAIKMSFQVSVPLFEPP